VPALGLVLAHEFGDQDVEMRLRENVEVRFEPGWDRSTGEFTWGFGLGEPVPRGQLNAVIMMAEVGDHGAWSRLFNRPNLAKFQEPAVSGVDFPALGISQAGSTQGNDAWRSPRMWVIRPDAASRHVSQ